MAWITQLFTLQADHAHLLPRKPSPQGVTTG